MGRWVTDMPDKDKTMKNNETPKGVELLRSYFVKIDDDFVPKPNIADMFDEDTLDAVAEEALKGYDSDRESMSRWLDEIENGLKLVKIETMPRSEPWAGAANYKTPDIAIAANKFSDRAEPEILRNKDLFRFSREGVEGKKEKEDRINRLEICHNVQLNEEMKEWRPEQRKLIYLLPYDGTVFKRPRFSADKGRNTSDLIKYPYFTVNNDADSVHKLTRFSIDLNFNGNEIYERKAKGIWLDVDLSPSVSDVEGSTKPAKDEDTQDVDDVSSFIEQEGFYDLDEDGYREPYVFTIHKSSKKIVRIAPRFELEDVFVKSSRKSKKSKLSKVYEGFSNLEESDSNKVKVVEIKPHPGPVMYGFLDDPQGGLLSIGYPVWLAALAQASNALTNQLINAGSLENNQNGFLSNAFRRHGGKMKLKPGEWRQLNLSSAEIKDGIIPLPITGASQTLFNMLIEINRKIQESSASADLAAAMGPQVTEATTLALLEDQQKSSSAIVGNILNSMKEEFKALFELNSKFLDPEWYKEVVDDENADFKKDFDLSNFDIFPTAKPEIASRAQRVKQAETMLASHEVIAANGGNTRIIVEDYVRAIDPGIADEIFPEESNLDIVNRLAKTDPEVQELITQQQATVQQQMELAQQQAAKEMELAQDESERRDAEVEVKVAKQELEERKTQAEIHKIEAETIETYEKAESLDNQNDRDGIASAQQIEAQALINQKQQIENQQAAEQNVNREAETTVDRTSDNQTINEGTGNGVGESEKPGNIQQGVDGEDIL